MGIERVIPGTPLDQIPKGDRPVFDINRMNGIPGLTPGAGGAAIASLPVQRYQIRASQASPFPNQWLPATTSPTSSASLAAATSTQLYKLFGFPSNASGSLFDTDAIIQDLTPASTGGVLLGLAGTAANQGLLLTGQPPVRWRTRWDQNAGGFLGSTLQNTDSVAHTLTISIMGIRTRPVFQSFAQQLPFAFGPTDAMVIRAAGMVLSSHGAVDDSYLMVTNNSGGPGSGGSGTFAQIRLVGRGRIASPFEGAYLTSPGCDLERPVTIYGTDGPQPVGKPWLVWQVAAAQAGNQTSPQPNYWAIVDYYPGGNQ